MARSKLEIIIKDTHRGLWYEDGVLTRVLEAGRYKIPLKRLIFFRPKPLIQVELVDMRERDLTIKGQEILTADKVALRVSIIVQFRVVDPKLALHAVEKYEDRLYSDVQLAARRDSRPPSAVRSRPGAPGRVPSSEASQQEGDAQVPSELPRVASSRRSAAVVGSLR